MNISRALIILICLNSSVGWAAKLIIKSQPEGAEIFISTNGKPIRLGITPYEANLTEVIKSYVKANSFMIELKKSGHNSYRVLLAKTEEVDLELTANLELDPAISNLKEHDSLMNQLFDIQKLIRGRNFQDAISSLGLLETKHPALSIIPEMKATAYYMNKEVENALSHYRRAFALNPENHDAYRMKVYLEKKLGIDVGAKQ
jgi:tetratricopeptide (TPR) repeat protein